ncbi:MAG: hypothetical protein E7073_06285 [Bacteroidales bacterium]|jgi:predicted RNA-binding protein (virulence factor B family)|nr:hypothetical protein [Bacteroidales bacterium]MBQ3681399.1 winged helix-turn-helix domain-containing protein [Paludibacteraceae bacterium]MBQ6963782.1 winged helix-turn-helix domain-containing protein [Paludibacteraceae bacterium]MBQ7748081.1 winged helix-turn-helix domain-containing protein [Paludibacteraceae bacterium]MBR0499186.1 winged helix-turn-helix domain-containing protein [Paludibacteraceae bacterium]
MKIEEIGENAGKIWNALSDGSTKEAKEIKKAAGIKDKEFYTALGWLAREGKVNIEVDKTNVYVKLV